MFSRRRRRSFRFTAGAKEGKEETAELMESLDSVYLFLHDRTVSRCKRKVL